MIRSRSTRESSSPSDMGGDEMGGTGSIAPEGMKPGFEVGGWGGGADEPEFPPNAE